MDRLLSEEELTEHIKACFENGRPMYNPTLDEVLEMIKSIPSVEPCEDAISRQAVLDEIQSAYDSEPLTDEANGVDYINKEMMEDFVDSLLPVTPQPKTGHWIRVDKDKLRCSECDVIHFIAQYPQGKIAWCPNCGAKMESEDKE